MKKLLLALCSTAMFGIGFMFTGCDWSSGGSDFNTSRGSVDINISGFYRGELGGGFAVLQKEGGAVTSFVIQQSGNVVEVTDSNGQKYFGTVGSSGAVLAASVSTIPAGTTVANFQIAWSGTDGTAAIEIEFTGVIDVVATQNLASESTIGVPNNGGSGNNEVNTTPSVIVRTFNLGENTSQFRLRGTWIEANGGSFTVSAISPGAGSLSIQGLDSTGAATGSTVEPDPTFFNTFAITPEITDLAVNNSQVFSVTGGLAGGNISWTLSNSSIGKISGSGNSITYKATAAGTQTITAVAQGGIVSDTLSFTQTAASFTVTPGSGLNLPSGSSQLYIASGGSGSFTWSVQSPANGFLSASSGSQVTYTALNGAPNTNVITVSDGLSVQNLAVTHVDP